MFTKLLPGSRWPILSVGTTSYPGTNLPFISGTDSKYRKYLRLSGVGASQHMVTLQWQYVVYGRQCSSLQACSCCQLELTWYMMQIARSYNNWPEIHKQGVVWDGHRLIRFWLLCWQFCCCSGNVKITGYTFEGFKQVSRKTTGAMLMKFISKVLFMMVIDELDCDHTVAI